MDVDVSEHFVKDPRARRAARLLGWHVDWLAGAIMPLWFVALHAVGPDNPHGLVATEDAEDATDHRMLVKACIDARLAIEQPDGRLYFAGIEERSRRLYHLRANSVRGGEVRAAQAARVGGKFTSRGLVDDQLTAGGSAGEPPAICNSPPAPFPDLPDPSGSGIGAAGASPRALPPIASASQLPDPESPPTVTYPMGGQGEPAEGSKNGTTGTVARTKAKREPKPIPPEALELAEYLLAAIRSHKPDAVANVRGWARDIDLAMRIDGRSREGIHMVIDFAHRSRETFWRANLLSGAKLRAHFDQLQIQAGRAPMPARNTVGTGKMRSPSEMAAHALELMEQERKAGLR